jgi:hypothetical protein
VKPTRKGLDRFEDDAQAWRAAAGTRVPVYERLLEAAVGLLAAPAGPVEQAARERLDAAWRERRFSAPYDRPLLLMAALRAEAMRAGAGHPLHAALGAEPPAVDAVTRAALAAALADAPPRLHADLATRWVQTNETSRAVTWLWPAYLAGCGGGQGGQGAASARPLAIADVGCSAGLNLIGDRLPPLWADAGGQPLPLAVGARVVARLGLDARPLDVRRDGDVAWLRACVWPGETARLARLDRAVEAMRAAQAAPGEPPPTVETADVKAVPARLEALAAGLPAGAVLLAYQTVVREYLPPDLREQHAASMKSWLANGGPGGPQRVFVELEIAPEGWTGTEIPNPMALTAQVAGSDGGPLQLARCGYHPTVLTPDPTAVAAFIAATAARQ